MHLSFDAVVLILTQILDILRTPNISNILHIYVNKPCVSTRILRISNRTSLFVLNVISS